jgi:hypothetical protein
LNNKNKLGSYPFIIKWIIWLFSIFSSVLISIYFLINILNFVGNIYQSKHPTPLEEDDLGAGLVMVFYLFIVFLSAIALSYFLITFFRKFLSKSFGVIND